MNGARRPMMSLAMTAALGAVLAGGAVACRHDAPPPQRVVVPSEQNRELARQRDFEKPMPHDNDGGPRGGYVDAPVTAPSIPEAHDFVDAYHRVGQPRLTVFVNRTLEGNVLPVNPGQPLATVERTRTSNGAVTVESRDAASTYGRADDRWTGASVDARSARNDRFQATAPVTYRDRTDVYLKPGQYDEVNARSLDYAALENQLADWLTADGQVRVVAPMLARQRLSDKQVQELQGGRPQVLSEIADQLGADVLVHVQAHPTRQTDQGLAVRVVAEVMNVRGGDSLGHAYVDIDPPLTAAQIDGATRVIARKLMVDMIRNWQAGAPQASQSPQLPQSPQPPAAPKSPLAPATPVPPTAPAAPQGTMPPAPPDQEQPK